MLDLPPCVSDISAFYGVPYALMQAVAYTESRGNHLAVNKSNRNGTEDVGLFQINSIWLPVLKKNGITKQELYDPCVNAAVGAWILRKYYLKKGTWAKAIAAYNAGPYRIEKGRSYAVKVIRIWYSISMR